MRWPWQSKLETRAATGGYSDLILAGLQQQAEGLATVPTGLAAVEQAAGLWSRAMASAEVTGGMGAITPEVLAIVGRELVRHGERPVAHRRYGRAAALCTPPLRTARSTAPVRRTTIVGSTS